MSAHPSTGPLRVVVAGGGVAALETALAVRDLAAGLVDLTVVTNAEEFIYRPLAVREPFSYAGAHHYPLADIVREAGAMLVNDAFAWVDPDRRVLHTESEIAIPYDALVLAVGARRYERFRHATTIDDARIDEILHGVVQDVEEGCVHRIAFVMPADSCWPLPLYELALMTAARAYAMCVKVDITIVTPERAPLAAFGTEASGAVQALLTDRGIGVEAHAAAVVPDHRHVVVRPGDRTLEVDRVIALPELHGPSIRGLHGGEHGFIPVDDHCRVVGVDRIWAAGDATSFPIKHGGLASQMADTAARGIADLAGAEVSAGPLRPVINGLLLTGRDPLYIRAFLVAGTGFQSEVSSDPLWSPPTKIVAKYLGPYLEKLDHAGV